MATLPKCEMIGHWMNILRSVKNILDMLVIIVNKKKYNNTECKMRIISNHKKNLGHMLNNNTTLIMLSLNSN